MAEKKLYGTLYGGDPAKQRKLLTETLGFMMPADRAEAAARGLQEALGSFSAMVTAPKKHLAAMPGMDERAARFLHLVADLAQLYMEEQAGRRYRVTDSASAIALMRPKFLSRSSEAVCVMLLDSQRQVLFNDILTEGALGEVPLYVRRLINLCIEYNAPNVILAHNHPSGISLPSREDTVITKQLANALMSIDARLRDHIIFAADGEFSFFGSGILGEVTAQMIEKKRRELDETRKYAELLAEEGLVED